MKKRICLLFIIFIFLTGCTVQDDFLGAAVQNSDIKVGIYNELPQEEKIDEIITGRDSFNEICNALNTTFLKEYTTLDEDGFYIDIDSCLNDYIKKNNLTSAPMPKGDYVRLVHGYGEIWNEYKLVTDNDLVYIVNSDNEVMEGYCLLLFSKNTEVKDALTVAGYENLYKIIEINDAKILSAIGTSKIPFYNISTSYCEMVANLYGMHFLKNSAVIPAASEYLTKLYQNDCWIIQHGGTNDVCDSISFLYTDEYIINDEDEPYYAYMRMDLYGKDGGLKEVKLTYDSVLDVIPPNSRFTLTECLVKLGCSKDEINSFYDKIPQKSGNIGKLHFITDEINNDNKVIKLYVK